VSTMWENLSFPDELLRAFGCILPIHASPRERASLWIYPARLWPRRHRGPGAVDYARGSKLLGKALEGVRPGEPHCRSITPVLARSSLTSLTKPSFAVARTARFNASYIGESAPTVSDPFQRRQHGGDDEICARISNSRPEKPRSCFGSRRASPIAMLPQFSPAVRAR